MPHRFNLKQNRKIKIGIISFSISFSCKLNIGEKREEEGNSLFLYHNHYPSKKKIIQIDS